MNRRGFIAVGVIVLVLCGTLIIWKAQGMRMRSHFVAALRNGEAQIGIVDLLSKQWTESELAAASVLKLPGGAGRQQALTRSIHLQGDAVISTAEFAYQGTVRDETTGIIHVFGYTRRSPQRWRWVSIHPASQDIHVQRRLQEVEEMGR